MAFWNRRKAQSTTTVQISNKPDWLSWNLPQWISQLPADRQTSILALPKEEQLKKFFEWRGEKIAEYNATQTSDDKPIGNPTGSHTDVGMPYATRVAEYRMTTPGGGMQMGATPGGIAPGHGAPMVHGGPMVGPGGPGGFGGPGGGHR